MLRLLAVLGLVLTSGGIWTARDYIGAGVEELGRWFDGQIPVVAKIEVMDESIQQLDKEIASNSRRVVEETVALERLEKVVAEKGQNLARTKKSLSALKVKHTQSRCEQSRGEVESAMAFQVARFKAQSEASKTIGESLSLKRDALSKMARALEQQKVHRDVLKSKLEGLRAEYESMRMRGQLTRSTLETSASAKADRIYTDIQGRLEVERRLWEQGVTEGSVDVEMDGQSDQEVFDMSTVDAILGQVDEVAIR